LFENLPKIKYLREKTKKYEENRKAPKFNVKWLTNREWLDYDESNDIMTCKDDDDDFCEDWRDEVENCLHMRFVIKSVVKIRI
jgi:hypothetical protein